MMLTLKKRYAGFLIKAGTGRRYAILSTAFGNPRSRSAEVLSLKKVP